jgi:hypothetical protein
MKVLNLAVAVSGTAVAAQAAVELTATPFVAGRDVVGVIAPVGMGGTPSVTIEGSDDGTTWVVLATNTTLGLQMVNLVLRAFMRFNVGTVGTGGTYNAYLLNGT